MYIISYSLFTLEKCRNEKCLLWTPYCWDISWDDLTECDSSLWDQKHQVNGRFWCQRARASLESHHLYWHLTIQWRTSISGLKRPECGAAPDNYYLDIFSRAERKKTYLPAVYFFYNYVCISGAYSDVKLFFKIYWFGSFTTIIRA